MSRFAGWGVGVVSGAVLALVPTAAASVGTGASTAFDEACADTQPESAVPSTARESQPLLEMDIATAHRLLARDGVEPGAGVVVAVIDSGVSPLADIDVAARVPLTGAAPENYHGTVVASLIAGNPRPDDGAIGIAPAAQVLDIQVYDDPAGSSGTGIGTEQVVAGLQDVLTRVRGGMNIKVVNISLALPDDPRMQPLIDQLWELDVVVVAPTGNRPGAADENSGALLDYSVHHSGEDAAEVVHPARYERVLAVNASMSGWSDEEPATKYVLESSRTDLAAPAALGVAYAVNGGTCLLGAPATSWAAAAVSGVLAMNQSLYDESAGRATQRLMHTADGRTDVTTMLAGAGEVQPVAALTRPLVMDEDGNIDRSDVADDRQRVTAPTEDPDLLAATRRNAVWWGLIGGGALLLALVLRPVLAAAGPTRDR